MASSPKSLWLKTFFRLDKRQKGLLIEAVICLFLAKLLISVSSFKWLSSRRILKPGEHTEVATAGLRAIAVAIHRANKLAYWKNVCFVSSCAARMMLSRRNIHSVMHFGLRFKDASSMEAHAWLTVGEHFITPPLSGYKELYTC